MVVTIDGPSGVGKSTVTRSVAAALGLPYLDTGAVYRAVTLAVLRSGVAVQDSAGAAAVAARTEVDYDRGVIALDGEDVSSEVRSASVTAAVSEVSAIPAVRRRCVAMQREWVHRRGGDAVVEGRDIGSVVFPHASVKVFLTAPPEIRAARRAGDHEVAGVAMAEIAADMARRDQHDSTRQTSPLRPAPDAVVLDTSELDVRGVVDAVLALVDAADRAARHATGVSDLE